MIYKYHKQFLALFIAFTAFDVFVSYNAVVPVLLFFWQQNETDSNKHDRKTQTPRTKDATYCFCLLHTASPYVKLLRHFCNQCIFAWHITLWSFILPLYINNKKVLLNLISSSRTSNIDIQGGLCFSVCVDLKWRWLVNHQHSKLMSISAHLVSRQNIDLPWTSCSQKNSTDH